MAKNPPEKLPRVPYMTRWQYANLELVRDAAAMAPKQSIQDFIEENAVAAARRKLDAGKVDTASNAATAARLILTVAADAVKEAHGSNWESDMIDFAIQDSKSLEKVAEMIKAADIATARTLAAGLDAMVREMIPAPAWEFLFPRGS